MPPSRLRSPVAGAASIVILACFAVVSSCLVQDVELVNLSFSFAGWTSTSGPGETYIGCSLTNGAFTVEGDTARLPSDVIYPPSTVAFNNLALSNGNLVVRSHFPPNTSVVVNGASGTVTAGAPFIDAASAQFSSPFLCFIVLDSSLEWVSTQSQYGLIHLPASLSSSGSFFVLGNTVTGASAVIEAPASFQMSERSAVAVDYTSCSRCAHGLVHGSDSWAMANQSMLRISHSRLVSPGDSSTLVALDDLSAEIQLWNSLLVMENISAEDCSLFGSAVVLKGESEVTLRGISVRSIGATVSGAAKVQSVEAGDLSAAIPSAVMVAPGNCAAACIPGASVDASCRCQCPAGMPYENFCTAMVDPYTDYKPTGCSSGCAACFNETACSVCEDGYTLLESMQCARSTPCIDDNCGSCTTAGQCTGCVEGYGLVANGACIRCITPHCRNCPADPARCQSCYDGITLQNGECASICDDTHCTSCPTSASTCDRCTSGYGLVNGACDACETSNCDSCDSDATRCTQCAASYYLTSLFSCSPTPCSLEHCLQCDTSDASRCASCISPYQSDTYDGQCIQPGECEVANCQSCKDGSSRLCAACEEGASLSSDGTQCTSVTTQACEVANCQKCRSGDSLMCDVCDASFYQMNGVCQLIGSCFVTNCAQCVLLDNTVCTTCMDGFQLTSSNYCVAQKTISSGAAAPYSLWMAASVLLASVVTYVA